MNHADVKKITAAWESRQAEWIDGSPQNAQEVPRDLPARGTLFERKFPPPSGC
jgi:hypothetical protein